MFRQLWPARKWLVILSFLLFNVFMTDAALENRVRIVFGEVYDTREEVALYLFNYGELPRNFLTMDESDAAFISYYVAMDRGLNIGGDTFRYEGEIIKRTDTTTLGECDLYTDRDALIEANVRGTERLVYTVGVSHREVFYTDDHYATFSRVTRWGIQGKSNAVWILLGLCDAVMAVYFVRHARREDFSTIAIDEPTKNLLESALTVLAFPAVAAIDVAQWIASMCRRSRLFAPRSTH